MKRPKDTVTNAIHVAKIATGEAVDSPKKPPKRPTQRHKGGKARAKALSAKKRSDIARCAAKARWHNS